MGFRLLMASDWYPPYIGGAERQTELLSKELSRRGHELSVATTWSGRAPARQNDEGVDVHRLRGWTARVPGLFRDADWKRPHPPFPDPGIVLGLRRLIRRQQPDVVHATGWIAYSCVAALAGAAKATPLVISWREYGYSCAQRSLEQNGSGVCDGPAPLKCARCAAHVYGPAKGAVMAGSNLLLRPLLERRTTTSHAISSYVEGVVRRDFGGSAAGPNVRLIPDFVVDPIDDDNDGAQQPLDAQAQSYVDRLPAEPFILFVGQLQRNKGIFVLLEAYERLVDPPPLVLMGAVGPGSPRRLPANVTLIRDVPHAAVMAAWERALFGVAPSIWPETFCTVITEAMTRGKPVIANRLGGPIDLIRHGETGLLLPPGDVAALAQAMQLLSGDATLRARMGVGAKQHVRQFTPPAVIPRFEALYAELVGRAATAAPAGGVDAA